MAQTLSDKEMIEAIIKWKEGSDFDLSFVYFLRSHLKKFGKLNRNQKVSLQNIYAKCEKDAKDQPIEEPVVNEP